MEESTPIPIPATEIPQKELEGETTERPNIQPSHDGYKGKFGVVQLSLRDQETLRSGATITKTIIDGFMALISSAMPTIEGLYYPLAKSTDCKRWSRRRTYIQIVEAGEQHWVTIYGHERHGLYVFDPRRQANESSLAHSISRFLQAINPPSPLEIGTLVKYPPLPLQWTAVNDTGLAAIAIAVCLAKEQYPLAVVYDSDKIPLHEWASTLYFSNSDTNIATTLNIAVVPITIEESHRIALLPGDLFSDNIAITYQSKHLILSPDKMYSHVLSRLINGTTVSSTPWPTSSMEQPNAPETGETAQESNVSTKQQPNAPETGETAQESNVSTKQQPIVAKTDQRAQESNVSPMSQPPIGTWDTSSRGVVSGTNLGMTFPPASSQKACRLPALTQSSSEPDSMKGTKLWIMRNALLLYYGQWYGHVSGLLNDCLPLALLASSVAVAPPRGIMPWLGKHKFLDDVAKLRRLYVLSLPEAEQRDTEWKYAVSKDDVWRLALQDYRKSYLDEGVDETYATINKLLAEKSETNISLPLMMTISHLVDKAKWKNAVNVIEFKQNDKQCTLKRTSARQGSANSPIINLAYADDHYGALASFDVSAGNTIPQFNICWALPRVLLAYYTVTGTSVSKSSNVPIFDAAETTAFTPVQTLDAVHQLLLDDLEYSAVRTTNKKLAIALLTAYKNGKWDNVKLKQVLAEDMGKAELVSTTKGFEKYAPKKTPTLTDLSACLINIPLFCAIAFMIETVERELWPLRRNDAVFRYDRINDFHGLTRAMCNLPKHGSTPVSYPFQATQYPINNITTIRFADNTPLRTAVKIVMYLKEALTTDMSPTAVYEAYAASRPSRDDALLALFEVVEREACCIFGIPRRNQTLPRDFDRNQILNQHTLETLVELWPHMRNWFTRGLYNAIIPSYEEFDSKRDSEAKKFALDKLHALKYIRWLPISDIQRRGFGSYDPTHISVLTIAITESAGGVVKGIFELLDEIRGLVNAFTALRETR